MKNIESFPPLKAIELANKKLPEIWAAIEKARADMLSTGHNGLVAIAPVFIPLFLGKGFEESIVLLQIFAFLLIIIGLSNCLNTHFLGPSGRQGKNNYVLITGAAVNFCCNFISIPRYGAIGAACASVIAELLILIGYLYLIKDFFKAKRLLALGWRYWIAGIVMFVIVSLARNSFSANLSALIIQICVGSFVYFGILALIKDKFFRECLFLLGGILKNIPKSKR